MPLKVIQKEIEAERKIGYRMAQMQVRAETLVPGAGRDPIDVLLWDANAHLIRTDVQSGRVVLDGGVVCQAVYRMGEETSLRALTARTNISQAVDIDGAEEGMLSRAKVVVDSTEARYENGHMVFQVGLTLYVWVMRLETVSLVEGIEADTCVQQKSMEICVQKLAAEANETMVLTDRVALPASLDARAALMDWGSVEIDSEEQDLGGYRVKGRAMIETLISSGQADRPAALLRHPIAFDKLIELPEWLAKDARASAVLRGVRSQVEQAENGADGALTLQADISFSIQANPRTCTSALEDAYAVCGNDIVIERRELDAVSDVIFTQTTEMARGTAMLPEGARDVGAVIAVRVQPNIAEIKTSEGRSRITGILDAVVLYTTASARTPASLQTAIEFSADVPQSLQEDSQIVITVLQAEAGGMMGDQLDIRVNLNISCMTRIETQYSIATDVREGDAIERRTGFVIFWPEAGDDAWMIGRRYHVGEESVKRSAENGEVEAGKPIVIAMR